MCRHLVLAQSGGELTGSSRPAPVIGDAQCGLMRSARSSQKVSAGPPSWFTPVQVGQEGCGASCEVVQRLACRVDLIVMACVREPAVPRARPITSRPDRHFEAAADTIEQVQAQVLGTPDRADRVICGSRQCRGGVPCTRRWPDPRIVDRKQGRRSNSRHGEAISP